MFRISDGDPLLWQLSYLDSEISKIIQSRFSGGTRLRPSEPREETKKDSKSDKRQTVKRMHLDPEETCCVCYEVMKPEENLAFCKYGCGRNIHTDCIEVWVKHKISVAQKITCPVIYKGMMCIVVQDRLGEQCFGGVEGGNEAV